MSQDNVGLVRAGFEAFAQGDIEAVLRLCDEDILVTQPSEMPDAAPLPRGHAGVLENIAAWPQQFDDYRIEILRTVETSDHVVATVHQTGRGKATGIPVETQATMVFAIREGKIAEWRVFLEEDEAFDAVGLRKSRENVEVVRLGYYGALNRGDLGVAASQLAPDAEIVTALSAVEGGSYRGREGLRHWWDDFSELFADMHLAARDFTVSGDLVMATTTVHARGRGSTVAAEQEFTHVFRLRDAKIVWFKSFIDRIAALEAVGLWE
jgi:ketosteroid isomerase-like protein